MRRYEPTTNPVTVLRRARKIIAERPFHQGSYAVDANGTEVTTTVGAVCCCSFGALKIAAGAGAFDPPLMDAAKAAVEFLAYANGIGSVPVWHDAKGRTKRQVIAAFDRAIKLAQKERGR